MIRLTGAFVWLGVLMAAANEVRESPWSAEGDAAFRVTAWLEAGRPVRLRVVTQLGKYGSEESIFEFANGELRSGRVFAECLESICEPGLSQQRLRFNQGRIVAVETRRAASLTLLLQEPYRATPVSMALATIEAVESYLRSPGIQRSGAGRGKPWSFATRATTDSTKASSMRSPGSAQRSGSPC